MAIGPFSGRSMPFVPIPIGSQRQDSYRDVTQIWDGVIWKDIGQKRETIEIPLPEELEKYPALRTAWDDFMTIKKLTGV